MRVSGNTAAVLSQSRYADAFDIRGDRHAHYGAFR
jgi:hypothetical protein